MKKEKNIDNLLNNLDACESAKGWARGKSFEEILNTCHRGDWLLWLFFKTMPKDDINLRRLTLAKSHCANTVRHLMKDDRSKKAIDTGILFGNNEATREELDAAAADDAAYASASAYADAKTKNQLETADICRKYLPLDYWNIQN